MRASPSTTSCSRSHADVHNLVLSCADRFYADEPYHVRVNLPWNGTGRGEEAKLKPELRLALAQTRYVLVHYPDAVLNHGRNLRAIKASGFWSSSAVADRWPVDLLNCQGVVENRPTANTH